MGLSWHAFCSCCPYGTACQSMIWSREAARGPDCCNGTVPLVERTRPYEALHQLQQQEGLPIDSSLQARQAEGSGTGRSPRAANCSQDGARIYQAVCAAVQQEGDADPDGEPPRPL